MSMNDSEIPNRVGESQKLQVIRIHYSLKKQVNLWQSLDFSFVKMTKRRDSLFNYKSLLLDSFHANLLFY